MNETQLPVTRVVVLHGYTANPGRHWFRWLADELSPHGITVTTPALPDSSEPQPEAWVQAAREAIGEPDEGLVVVGHSLGCITALEALAGTRGGSAAGPGSDRGSDWRLGALILVAGFDTGLSSLPALDGFTARPIDYAPIIRNTRVRRMIASDNDPVVAPALSHDLAASLRADVTVVAGGGHFGTDDGFDTFPLLAELVRSL
ncbi:RBBP9/YdeN family alpha/beta hydrolase [Subtercola boreus]|uniref:Alpha/beta hydrolase n=1 Tax=Subtercola boreus TaxID=120213 RepID=A0A3E0WGB8_9MICO|nr:alpha/beta fold hydrolase [Subtercola boreus]RFA23540.1 hypothetical protein B7R24_01250 [Subtercola boreus]RFA23934.1 hypothetical protein B7R23_01250 [Subtercola boreus]RFA29633.1 hypothetical protein B7R25_01245 [Subtercola boreus]